ncbi:MAG TPA: Gfo/Idh/MocA family oxidoreductase [Polyangiaceae bacterium]|nr:Gfo/Idh/MocA family oxidoreductase [Polyangiaceae bacterium]
MDNQPRRVRYAVVGAGNIAQVAILPAFAHAKESSELVAIVSGDATKRAALRERYSLAADGDYSEFERVLERSRAEAVYVATPNATHKEYTLRAAAAGRHVLCEKPLAPSETDCFAMDAACRKAGLKLMVAYRLHFERATLAALELVRSGRLGDVKLFSSFFTHVVREGDIRQDPSLAGGAAYDMGVYCINTARNVFDAEPVSVTADIVEKNGTDDTTSVMLRFPGDRIAQFCISNSVAGVSSYRIGGTEGDLRVEPAYEYVEELVHYLTIDGKLTRESFSRGDQFAPEIKYFSDCVIAGSEPEPSAEEGRCDVRVVEAILASAREHRPVELAPYRRSRRPSAGQAEHVRPVGKQTPVNAPGPSVK